MADLRLPNNISKQNKNRMHSDLVPSMIGDRIIGIIRTCIKATIRLRRITLRTKIKRKCQLRIVSLRVRKILRTRTCSQAPIINKHSKGPPKRRLYLLRNLRIRVTVHIIAIIITLRSSHLIWIFLTRALRQQKIHHSRDKYKKSTQRIILEWIRVTTQSKRPILGSYSNK